MTEETKRKISLANKGKQHNKETKRKMSLKHKGNIMSDKTKRKISLAHKGKNLSKETKRKLSLASKGHSVSLETRKKISIGNKGKKRTNENKIKISLANKGNCHTKETKRKISLANKGKIISEKTLIKKRKIKDIQQIIDILQNTFKYEGIMFKGDFFNNEFVKEKISGIKNKKTGVHGIIRNTLKLKKLTIDDIAIRAGVQFKQKEGFINIGKNEKQILDDIEKENNIHLERQFSIAGKFIDGYDPINNIAYEVDEEHHKYQKIQDIIRENIIKDKLGCEFIRIEDMEVDKNDSFNKNC